MNSVLLHQYSVLVDFLAGTLGTDYEVTLDDLSRKNPCTVAIANGYISGRSVGAPLTKLAMKLIKERSYEDESYRLNYRSISSSERVLRCSTFFLKNERGALQGLLGINFDDHRYMELSGKLFALCHPDNYVNDNISVHALRKTDVPFLSSEEGSLYENVNSEIRSALYAVIRSSELPASRLKKAERAEIIRILNKKGIFILKGAIPLVAAKLSCSSASVYRYLSELKKEEQREYLQQHEDEELSSILDSISTGEAVESIGTSETYRSTESASEEREREAEERRREEDGEEGF